MFSFFLPHIHKDKFDMFMYFLHFVYGSLHTRITNTFFHCFIQCSIVNNSLHIHKYEFHMIPIVESRENVTEMKELFYHDKKINF